ISSSSGSGSGEISVSVNTSGLAAQTYYGNITITSPQASNSESVTVCLKVYQNDSPPFGNYATPADNSYVSSSVAFTGWVLDDVGVGSVKLYREENRGLLYIGEASLVEGARPDVEASYPDYPNCSQAGWGYMMLTNFLPNGGNGTFVIHAIAVDDSGQQTTLGTRTIVVDNANAAKPFGAIDTPTQGGTASGSQYICWGWALTPMPNSIPTDGSTIDVWVDGVNVGHPVYNVYRSDIAGLFPGYANSSGAIGYFSLDTARYEDGVHTIQWTVKDNAGNSDGIGSRYFSIRNDSTSRQSGSAQHADGKSQSTGISYKHLSQLKTIPLGNSTMRVNEMQNIQVQLDGTANQGEWTGYMIVGNNLKALPIGSTLDRDKGIFYWLPGPGFYGDYSLVFVQGNEPGNQRHSMLNIHIGSN
ncbi:MAG: hypothetical protein GY940_01490, partial [bacterium]|nr:hypothetical protein [bacterium]